MSATKPSKTVISHGSSFEGIRLTVRDDRLPRTTPQSATTDLTPTEAVELAHHLLITVFQMGYTANARKRS